MKTIDLGLVARDGRYKRKAKGISYVRLTLKGETALPEVMLKKTKGVLG